MFCTGMASPPLTPLLFLRALSPTKSVAIEKSQLSPWCEKCQFPAGMDFHLTK